MVNIKRILVPCDFSDASRHALEHAAALAARYRAELIGLHVFPVMPLPVGDFAYLPPPPRLSDESRARLLGDLKRFLDPVRIADLPQRAFVLEGDPVWEILQQAKEQGADLLVIGTHGRRGLERWALGSVAEKLVRRAECPMLTVPPKAGPPAPAGQVRFERLLCAFDFSDPAQHALRYAVDLATEMGAKLTVLNSLEAFVEEESRFKNPALAEYRQMMIADAKSRLKEAIPAEARDFCSIEELVVTGTAYKQVLAHAEQDNSDLIVLGARGHSAMERLFLGSVAQHVVRAAHCPVLTVR